jgi:hypothetical protein
MILTRINSRKRGAATSVELAAVLIIFVLLLFGMLEYCRLCFTMTVVENAAREGARYAIVNLNGSTIVTDTQAQVLTFMDGLNVQDAPYSCDLYLTDGAGANLGSPANAQFGQFICCDVSVTYVPVTPGLYFMKTFTLRSKCTMMSEAN